MHNAPCKNTRMSSSNMLAFKKMPPPSYVDIDLHFQSYCQKKEKAVAKSCICDTHTFGFPYNSFKTSKNSGMVQPTTDSFM